MAFGSVLGFSLADSRTYRITLLPLLAGGVAIWVVFTHVPVHTGSQWLGLTLAIIGLAGIVAARWTLGRSFSITPQARQLVTRGIYSKIRNPIYLCGTVFIAGLILITRMLWLCGVLAALVVIQVVRARKEAHVLEAKFGDEYRRYRDQTWF